MTWMGGVPTAQSAVLGGLRATLTPISALGGKGMCQLAHLWKNLHSDGEEGQPLTPSLQWP